MKMRQYPTDPVLVRSDFRCAYCGRDLLADLDTFLTFARDHLVPRSAGGPDGAENRVAACACCDRLKGDALVFTIEEARAAIGARRSGCALWFDVVRQAVRSTGS